VQARKQQLDLRLRALESFQAGYAAAQELRRAGNIPELDVANQRAQVEVARIAVAEAENAWLDAREQLALVLGGASDPARIELAGRLELPEGEAAAPASTEGRAVEASLELAELRRRMEAASRRVGLARTEGALPHLSGGFHAERDEAVWEIGGHVTIGLPVFDRAQGRRMSAHAEFVSLRERYLAAAARVRASFRMAQTRIESTRRRARHFREQVIPAREKALEQTLLQYNAMQADVFQLLQAQRAVTEAASAYLDTVLEHWRARAALEGLLGGRQRGVALGTASVRRDTAASGESQDSGGH